MNQFHSLKLAAEKKTNHIISTMDAAVSDLQAEVNRLHHQLQTLKVQQQSEDGELITISEYILKRLEQLSVTVCISFNYVH